MKIWINSTTNPNFLHGPKIDDLIKILKIADLAKSLQNDGFAKSSPATGGTGRTATEERDALTVRCNDEAEAARRR